MATFINLSFSVLGVEFEKCIFWPKITPKSFFSVKMSFFSLLRKKASFGYCTFAHEIIKEAKFGSLAQLD